MSYSINNTSAPSQNVPKPEAYTREEIQEEVKHRGSKRAYASRPGETARQFGDEQQANQSGPVHKKTGIRGLFSRDHARGAEKEHRKELYHAEKAERFAVRSRDPAISDKERKKWLRKAAKQQASADFHESLKKKHIIGATPGHKYQVVPAVATHHPIIHDNTNNTIRTQTVPQNAKLVGVPAFDGIAEFGSHPVIPAPAVAAVPMNVAPLVTREVIAPQPAHQQEFVYSYPAADDEESSTDDSFADQKYLDERAAKENLQKVSPHELRAVAKEIAPVAETVEKEKVSQSELRAIADAILEPSYKSQKSKFSRGELREASSKLRHASPVQRYGINRVTAGQLRKVQLKPRYEKREALPFGSSDLQGVKLQPRYEQREALPFGSTDLQGAALKPRYEQHEALPFSAADLQLANLKPRYEQHESLPFSDADLQSVQLQSKWTKEARPWTADEIKHIKLHPRFEIHEALPFTERDLQEKKLSPRYRQHEALPFGTSDLQSTHLKPIIEQHEPLPFTEREIQQVNLSPRYPEEKYAALPFGAADLQGVDLKPRFQKRTPLPFETADLRSVQLKAMKRPPVVIEEPSVLQVEVSSDAPKQTPVITEEAPVLAVRSIENAKVEKAPEESLLSRAQHYVASLWFAESQ